MLVTLGIIGVVSAMTVPTLMQNYQKKSYVTQLHKVYNELQQAAIQYQTDNNAIDLREAGLNGDINKAKSFISNYFKIVQSCGEEPSPCFADSYRKLSGISTKVEGNEFYTLASGASIGIVPRGSSLGTLVMDVVVDINGQSDPNILGRDLFIMYLYKNGVIDEINWEEQSSGGNAIVDVPLEPDYRERMFNTYCQGSGNHRRGCFGKILNDNWEMTY